MSKYDDETLVAFLDGELSDQDAHGVKEQLESDNHLRQRLEGLRQTWVLLEDLPEPDPNPQLAQSTLELLTLQIEADDNRWHRRLVRNKLFVMALGTLTMALIGAGAGQVVSQIWKQTREAKLPYVAEFEAFSVIPDNNWLDQLCTLQNLCVAFPGDQIGEELVPTNGNQAELEEWLRSLSDVDLDLLRSNERKYSAMTLNEQAQFRKVVDQVNESADRFERLEVARSYASLLAEQTGRQQGKILDQSPEDRLESVRRIVNRRMLGIYPTMMTDQDRSAIREWAFINQLSYADSTEFLDPSSVYDEDLEKLTQSLSQNAQDILEPHSAEMRRLPLSVWITSVTNPTPDNAISPELMLDKLDELDDVGSDQEASATLEEIELLPEGAARSKLRSMLRKERGE